MISAAGSPLSVSVLRHVRSLGHCVIGLNANLDTEPLGRAFCDEFHIAPKADSPAYLDFLCKRLAEVDVFLPFIDEELVAIGEGWQGFPSDLADRIAISEPDVLLDCVDKCRFQRACEESNLPIAPEANAAPAFYKPRYGRGGRGVIEARDSRLFEALQGRDGVLQKAISGDEFTVDAIFGRDGSLIATSPRRRMCTAGISTVGEVGPDKELHKLAERLGQRWHFRYAINFQVMRDIDDHDWIIELNPRLAGSAIFSALAGCDPFDATIALWKGESWHGVPRRLRVWRYWEERTGDLVR
jgi:carbamoyl-phosphate synthase large subunit